MPTKTNKPLRYRQIHLDFHTSEHIPGIGPAFDAEDVRVDAEERRTSTRSRSLPSAIMAGRTTRPRSASRIRIWRGRI